MGLLSAALLLTLQTDPKVRDSFTIVEENDFFAHVSASDKHYTQGLRLEYHRYVPDAPALVCIVPCFYRKAVSYTNGVAVGQEMYTPENIESPVPLPDDRPYAAWLYGAFLTTVGDDSRLWQDTWEFDLGMVGPKAFGDEIQSWWHRIIERENPTWRGQIDDEFAGMLSWKRQWSHEAWPEGECAEDATWSVRTITHLGARAGTVQSDLAVGAKVLFGYRVPVDYEAGRGFRPGPGEREYGLRFYGFAGVEGRFVPWNVFLDGNVFRDSPDIARKYVTADFSAGLVLRLGDGLGLSYAQVFRSGEISSDPRYHNFGSLALSWTVGF